MPKIAIMKPYVGIANQRARLPHPAQVERGQQRDQQHGVDRLVAVDERDRRRGVLSTPDEIDTATVST